MANIKNMGTATMRFKEGIIVTGSAGADVHSLVITGSSRMTGNLIVDSRIGIGTSNPGYKLEVGGSMAVGEYIYHRGDDNTYIRFQDDDINLQAGGRSMIKISEGSIDQVLIMSGGAATSPNVKNYTDTNFFVSGSVGSRGSSTAGTSVFGGDVVVSGSVHAPNGITGSITKAASDLDGNRILGGLYQLDDGLIQNPNSSYSRIYFPADDTLVETVGPVSHNYKIAPFSGELIKMQVKSIQDFTGKALTASLHVGTGTNNAYSATPAVSVALNGQAAHSVYTFDFLGRSGTTFSEGNIFGFSLELSENFAGNETIHFTSVVRFNPYS